MANRKKWREGAFGDRLPRTPIWPYASQHSPLGFDEWYQHHGVIGYYFTLHRINGSGGSYLSPAFLFLFILSFFLVTLSSLPSQTWIERLIFCLDNLLISLSHIRCAFWVFCVVWMDVGSEKSVCGRHVIWCKAFYPSSSHLKTISCSGKTFFDITFSLFFRPAVFMVALAVLRWGKLLPSTQEHEGSLRRPPCPAPAHLPHLSPHLRPRWMRPFPGPSPPPWQLTAPLLPPQPHWELPPWESPSLFPAELHPLWVHGDAGVHVSHRPLHL